MKKYNIYASIIRAIEENLYDKAQSEVLFNGSDSFVETWSWKISSAILPLPLIQEE